MPLPERPTKVKGKLFKEPLREIQSTLELRVFKEKTTLAKIRPNS